MSNTLGIDQSYTSSGYVVLSKECNILSFGRIRSDPSNDIYQRALDVAKEICALISQHNVSRVNLEGLAFGIRGSATRDLAGLLFTIINVIKINYPDIKCRVIAPTSVKKMATGSGKAKKVDMLTALPEDILNSFVEAGFKKTSGLPDITDAYWISRC